MVSTDERKRRLERAQFETFAKVSGRTFDDIEAGVSPEPDIIAVRGGEQLGVEITSFHRRGEMRNEREEALVVERAAVIYEQSGAPKLAATVMWAPHYKVEKRLREKLARELAAVVAAHAPDAGQWKHLSWPVFSEELTRAVDHIFVERLIKYSESLWTASGGGVVPEWDVASLQAEIDRKNAKPAHYQAAYHETWLLIVSAFGAPSA